MAPLALENVHSILDLGDCTIDLTSDSAGIFTMGRFGAAVNLQRERFPIQPPHTALKAKVRPQPEAASPTAYGDADMNVNDM